MLELNLIEFNLHQFIIYLRGRTPATSSARRTCIYFIYLFIYIYDCSLAKDPWRQGHAFILFCFI